MAKGFDEKVIAGNYSAAIVRLAGHYGVSEAAVLEGTGIKAEELHSTDLMISINQNTHLTSNAVKLTGVPHLGLILGQNLNVTAHGMMGVAVMSSKNLGDALNVASQFYKTRLSAFSAFTEISNDKLTFTIEHDSPDNENVFDDTSIEMAIHFAIGAVSSSILTIAKLLTHKDCHEFIYQFSHPAPPYKDEYIKILGDNVYFDQEVNRVTAPAYFAELPLAFYDETTLKLALKNCSQSLSMQQTPRLMKHKIKEILDKTEGALPDIEQLTNTFNMCSRTLRRKLKIEGTSYQELINERRLTLAKKYLINPELSIIRISSDLEFSDPSYFARVFKRWTGYLPTEYRKRCLNR